MAKASKRKRSAPPRARRKALAPRETGETLLKQQLAEARAQQAATAEILKVIARSPSDVKPVFDAIAESGRRLFGRDLIVRLIQGNQLVRVATTRNMETDKMPQSVSLDRSSIAGRAVLDGKLISVADIHGSAATPYAITHGERLDFRSIAAVPLMREGVAIGMMSVVSPNPGEMPEIQLKLLQTFADQAVIAIENVRLFNESKAHQEERLARLKSFFSPQLAELLAAGKGEELLKTHRREITVQFFDLRGFTAFTGAAEPEEVMELLRDFHGALGRLVLEHQGTIERFAGDSVMVFFNDPLPVERPAEQAMRAAIAMMRAFEPIATLWKKRGYDLGLGAGIAQGFATLGAIGFEGRRDYAAIGPVTNLAARLCAEAKSGQILADRKTVAALEGAFNFDALGDLNLKGFAKPVSAFALRRA